MDVAYIAPITFIAYVSCETSIVTVDAAWREFQQRLGKDQDDVDKFFNMDMVLALEAPADAVLKEEFNCAKKVLCRLGGVESLDRDGKVWVGHTLFQVCTWYNS
jgi:hypothetical protein